MAELLSDRMPPHDLEAERCVLGGCLLSEEARDDAIAIVRPEHFYSDGHQKSASAIYELHNAGKKVDAVLLGKELEKRKQLEGVGGPDSILKFLESVPHAAHTEHYANIVRENWVRRRIIDSCTESARYAFDPAWPVEDLVSEHDRSTQGLLEDSVASGDVFSIAEIVSQAVAQEQDKRLRLMSGFRSLDDIIEGLYGGDFITIGGRPSMGKTAFGLTLTLEAAKRGHSGLFISLEMSAIQLSERLLSMESGVPGFVVRNSSSVPTEEQVEWLLKAKESLSALTLYVFDRPYVKMSQIAAKARIYKRRHNIEFVVIDYLQLIEPDDARAPRELQVANINKRLKGLARDLDIPVVVLSQLNREVEKRPNKRPQLSDIRESGSSEQDSDQVWFVYREDYYHQGDASYQENKELEVIVAKHRNGPTGTAKLRFEKQSTRVVEPDGYEFYNEAAEGAAYNF